MRRSLFAVLIIVICAFLVGCGGSGPGPVTSRSKPTAKTKSTVSKHMAGYAGGAFTASAGSNLGGFGGHPLVKRRGVTSGGGGYGGGGDAPDYFDDYLQLYVHSEFTATSFTTTYFEDAAHTLPAGQSTTTFDFTSGQSIHLTISITKGPFAGTSGKFDQVFTDTSFESSYDNSNPVDGRYYGSFSGTMGLTTTCTGESHYIAISGYRQDQSYVYRPDGSSEYVASDSDGYKSVFDFNADGSGHGKIEGPDPGLPANVKWDKTGTGTITWADGSETPFQFWICQPD